METKRCSRCKLLVARENWTESQWSRGKGNDRSGFCRPCFNEWRRNDRSNRRMLRDVACGYRDCDKHFETASSRKRFCSTGCKVAEAVKRASDRARDARAENRCLYCGQPILDRPTSARWCSDECKHDSDWPRLLRIRSNYGIEPEVYLALLRAQEGRCAFGHCTERDRPGARLHVDHDHRCCPGKRSCGECVRGLLCARHNIGLGSFDDDVTGLKDALEYLAAVA